MHHLKRLDPRPLLETAWTRGWTTLEEIMRLASHSPVNGAEAIDIDPERVREALAAARIPLSLDSPIGEDSNSTIADVVADAQLTAPSDEVEAEIVSAHLRMIGRV